MIAFGDRVTKPDWSRFSLPCVERNSAQWLQLDGAVKEGHVARLIDGQVNGFDFWSLIESYKFSGSPPLRPDLMLKMVLYCYHRGITSPAKWVDEAQDNQVMKWLGQGIEPSRTVWYEFAARVEPFLDQFNGEVLSQANEHGLLSAEASLDGTTVSARASRHRLLNLSHVEKRIGLLEQAVAADQNNDPQPVDLYWMANTSSGRAGQLSRYRKSKRVLVKRHADNDLRIPSKRKPPDKIRVSVTDPEAPLGLDKHKVYRPLYNVQLLRDLGSSFILGHETFARVSDTGTLVPMLERGVFLSGITIKKLLVDSGYITGLDLNDASQQPVDMYGPWKSNDYSRAKKPDEPGQPFTKEDFHWDQSQSAYQCPQGETLTRRGTQTKKRSLGRTEAIDIYRGDAKTCQACPLKPKCCPKSKSGRNLNRSEHEPLIDALKKKWSCQPRKSSTSFVRKR